MRADPLDLVHRAYRPSQDEWPRVNAGHVMHVTRADMQP